jgi:hypothetical protein
LYILKPIACGGLFIYKKFRSKEFGGIGVRPVREVIGAVPHDIDNIAELLRVWL